MAPGAVAEIPAGYSERALYVAAGAVQMDGRRFETGQMLVLGPAASHARAIETSTVMVLGGEPVGERFIFWNFVSSSKDRLEQAAADWKAGRMALPDADDAEFIPLPDEPVSAPQAFS
jgi:redox-sensitive bicupin YhaK (pirin superfamily)